MELLIIVVLIYIIIGRITRPIPGHTEERPPGPPWRANNIRRRQEQRRRESYWDDD